MSCYGGTVYLFKWHSTIATFNGVREIAHGLTIMPDTTNLISDLRGNPLHDGMFSSNRDVLLRRRIFDNGHQVQSHEHIHVSTKKHILHRRILYC